MIPLRDNLPTRCPPVVTLLLVGLNTYAFLRGEASPGSRISETSQPACFWSASSSGDPSRGDGDDMGACDRWDFSGHRMAVPPRYSTSRIY
jgi:hypothetical protein